jgi:hypothetical protein
MNDHGKMSRATPGGDPLVPAVSLQPIIDFLASKYASEDTDDATFDAVAGSVLVEYAGRRDELEERHERDDLVSSCLRPQQHAHTCRLGRFLARADDSLL